MAGQLPASRPSMQCHKLPTNRNAAAYNCSVQRVACTLVPKGSGHPKQHSVRHRERRSRHSVHSMRSGHSARTSAAWMSTSFRTRRTKCGSRCPPSANCLGMVLIA